MTPQRVAVYTMLAHSASHPSPEEVYSDIRGQSPSVSLATIYKILDLFHQRGFIRKISTDGQVARYDAMVDPHHHLMCTRCGRIQDLMDVRVPAEEFRLPDTVDFEVSDLEVLVHGVCGECGGDRSRNPA